MLMNGNNILLQVIVGVIVVLITNAVSIAITTLLTKSSLVKRWQKDIYDLKEGFSNREKRRQRDSDRREVFIDITRDSIESELKMLKSIAYDAGTEEQNSLKEKMGHIEDDNYRTYLSTDKYESRWLDLRQFLPRFYDSVLTCETVTTKILKKHLRYDLINEASRAQIFTDIQNRAIAIHHVWQTTMSKEQGMSEAYKNAMSKLDINIIYLSISRVYHDALGVSQNINKDSILIAHQKFLDENEEYAKPYNKQSKATPAIITEADYEMEKA